MPNPSANTATITNPGDFNSTRRLCRRSRKMLVMFALRYYAGEVRKVLSEFVSTEVKGTTWRSAALIGLSCEKSGLVLAQRDEWIDTRRAAGRDRRREERRQEQREGNQNVEDQVERNR